MIAMRLSLSVSWSVRWILTLWAVGAAAMAAAGRAVSAPPLLTA